MDEYTDGYETVTDPVTQAQARVTEAAEIMAAGRGEAQALRDQLHDFMDRYTAAFNLGQVLGLADGHDSPAQLGAMIRTALPGQGRKRRAKAAQ